MIRTRSKVTSAGFEKGTMVDGRFRGMDLYNILFNIAWSIKLG